MPNQHPYLIVGQGLAGSVLAWHLEWSGIPFEIWDAGPQRFCSSYAAGGIFNPVTGRKLEKTWLADDLFPYLFEFYRRIEHILQANFFQPLPLFRPFSNPEMRAWLLERKQEIDSEYLTWASHGVWVHQAGSLDVAKFLQCSQSHWKSQGIWHERLFKGTVEEKEAAVVLEDKAYAAVIFCEGFHAQAQNPWFKDLCFLPAKGELMEIQSSEPKLDYILNKNGFLLPLGQDRYKLGATYDWTDLDDQESLGARKELMEKYRAMGYQDLKVLRYLVGIRPATQDRRPFVGFLPGRRLGIFNGFGSKGVSLSPYLAKAWLQDAMGGSALPAEANIQRFYP